MLNVEYRTSNQILIAKKKTKVPLLPIKIYAVRTEKNRLNETALGTRYVWLIL